jgi:hypothetical protein
MNSTVEGGGGSYILLNNGMELRIYIHSHWCRRGEKS